MTTLSTLRARIRRKLDEESAGFWSDAELDDYINEGYLEFWKQAVQGQYYKTQKTSLLNTVSGTAEISLPSDFLKFRLVEKVLPDRTVPLEYRSRFEQTNRTSGYGSTAYSLYTYDVIGSNLVLEPTPQVSETGGIKATYFYTPTRLSADSDEHDLGSIHDALLVAYACVQAKEKA